MSIRYRKPASTAFAVNEYCWTRAGHGRAGTRRGQTVGALSGIDRGTIAQRLAVLCLRGRSDLYRDSQNKDRALLRSGDHPYLNCAGRGKQHNALAQRGHAQPWHDPELLRCGN